MYANSTLAFRSRLYHCGHFTSHRTVMGLPMKSNVDLPTEGHGERKERIK